MVGGVQTPIDMAQQLRKKNMMEARKERIRLMMMKKEQHEYLLMFPDQANLSEDLLKERVREFISNKVHRVLEDGPAIMH
jgi:hypothetical protein